MAMKKLSYLIFAGRRFSLTPLSHPSPLISPYHFTKIFPRFVRSHTTVHINGHLQNPFAHFAASNFNLSPADIARMLKSMPHLQRLQTLDKVEEFVGMLNNHGFKQDQIAMIMRKQPTLVITSVERLLEPKLRLLKDYGIDGENLVFVLTRWPAILGLSLERGLVPKMTFLNNIFQSQDFLIKILLRAPSVLTYNLEKTLKPSLAFWEGCGFRGMDLAKFLCTRPTLLRCSSLTPAQVDLIHKTGIEKRSKMYKYILGLVACSRVKTLEAKIHNLQLCGLSTEETMEVFRAQPSVFGFSTERIRQNIEFLVNNIELPANSVVKQPKFLEVNLEKVKPRVSVLQEMKSMNRLGHLELKQVCRLLKMPEAKFLAEIVGRHPESSTLYGIYESVIANASNGTNISRKFRYF